MEGKVEEAKERKKLEGLLLVACERGLLDDAKQLVHLSGVYRFELVRDKKGRTPMHLAAARGRTAVLDFLWSKAADMDVEDDEGRTPLHLAAANGHVDCVRLLVDKGGAFMDSTESKHGFTAVEMAACRGQAAVVRELFERGCKSSWSADDLLRIPKGGGELDESGARIADQEPSVDGGRDDIRHGDGRRIMFMLACIVALFSVYLVYSSGK